MTNATDELRRLLDERGVEWRDESNGYVNVTTFIVNGIEWNAIAQHYLNSELDWMKLRTDTNVTPEQAIAATLGSDDRYDAGFASGIQAVFQQLEGIEDYEELQDLIAEYWREGEGYDER